MSDYICNGNKYILNNKTIALPMFLGGLPKELQLEGINLTLKSEFHITLVAVGKIVERYDVTIPNFQEKVCSDFCDYTSIRPIEFIQFRGEYRFVVEDRLRTLVVMCDVSNLAEFFDQINKKYNLHLENPPTHITLYVLPPGSGIYLSNSEDIAVKTKVVEVPNLSIRLPIVASEN